MAFIIDESFESGIPAGFADLVVQGSMGVSYNADAAAVDLSPSYHNNYWRMVSAGARQEFSIVADLEVISDPWNRRHLGFGLLAGSGSLGYRIDTLDNNAIHTYWWDNAWNAVDIGQTVKDSQPVIDIGKRYVMRLDFKRYVGNALLVDWFIDDVRVMRKIICGLYWYDLDMYPAIFCYFMTLRVHRVQVAVPWLSTFADDLSTFPSGLVDMPLLAQAPSNPPPPLNFSNHALLSAGDLVKHRWYFGGSGKIAGTVKRKGMPDDLPVARQVYLIDEATRTVVGATWSDAATGYYEFLNVALEYENGPTPQGLPNGPLFWGNSARRSYTVIATDYERNYRAVIADNLTAEAMS